MGKLPEREADFRSGPLRSEVELQSKLNVARVAGASKGSEVAGATSQSRVAQAAQRIVRAVENIEEVGLEHQAHVFSGQFEIFAQRQIRHENVRAGKVAHAVCSWVCWRRGLKSSWIKELPRSSWSKRYSRNSVRAPPAHIRAIHQYSIHDAA